MTQPRNEDIVSLNDHELDMEELENVAGGVASAEIDPLDTVCGTYCQDYKP